MSKNSQFDLALGYVSGTGENVFLTGRAGTGKTTFLHSLRKNLSKRMIVVAPTGVAAINAGGMTMHSFFQLPFGIYVPDATRVAGEFRRFSKVKIAIIKSIDLLVIDEISMVRADTLDNVDNVLRRFRDRNLPFGGVQLLMIGDMGQLAPVAREEEWEILRQYYASPYFFDSRALKATSYRAIELQHIYRQSDSRFIELLSRVRENRVDDAVLSALNERCEPDFDPLPNDGYITLTSHNSTARKINEEKLAAIKAPERVFRAEIKGDFPDCLYPAEAELRLKKGAQVMFTKNDPSPEKRFVNGTIGRVKVLDDDRIEVKPTGGKNTIVVEPAEWTNAKYSLDSATNLITEKVDGVFKQYPLRTAWAITIHKSQGLSFDRAVIDAGDSFSHGQVYVALSRCRTLEGMVLHSPLRPEAIICDATIEDFSRRLERERPDEADLERCKREYHGRLMCEMFDFEAMARIWQETGLYMKAALLQIYPKFVQRWAEASTMLQTEVVDVGTKFKVQIARMMQAGEDEALAKRVRLATDYFTEHTESLPALLAEASGAGAIIDNKEVKRRLREILMRTDRELAIKTAALEATKRGGFSVEAYLSARGEAIAAAEAAGKTGKATEVKGSPDDETPKAKKAATGTGTQNAAGDDILNPALFELLRMWRQETATALGMPAYVVATQKALTGIANTMPSTPAQLLAIKGIGPAFVEKYGATALQIVRDYRAEKRDVATQGTDAANDSGQWFGSS